MNKVELMAESKRPKEFKMGSIWEDWANLYILIAFPGGWCAASITNGNTWNGVKKLPQDAVKGLIFVSNSANISVYPICS